MASFNRVGAGVHITNEIIIYSVLFHRSCSIENGLEKQNI